MKIQKSNTLSAFGGMNFVFELLKNESIDTLIENHLPNLSPQSQYNWTDIVKSLLSIYLCGGGYIEDLQSHLKEHFLNNPLVKMPSPDTVLRRLSELSVTNDYCRTKRGLINHPYNTNNTLNQLNISLLNQQGIFDSKDLVLDYDNTIIFNEKSDSKMTYKRNPGYQPGVCTINEEHIVFIENRNGNSDAKSFQKDTLKRMFELLKSNNISRLNHFRADAASYQYDVVKLVEQHVDWFYIGCRNSYIAKYFTQINEWKQMIDSTGAIMEVGEIFMTPFQKQTHHNKQEAKEYRLIVKRKLKSSKQLDLFTQDSYEYRAILTNNFDFTPIDIAKFYNKRGNMERQFDILKNDFGWNNMPFSTMDKNAVFLCLTAFCRNLYNQIIEHFSNFSQQLKPTDRVKKFLFRFVILPAKWVKRSRQHCLRIFSSTERYSAYVNYST